MHADRLPDGVIRREKIGPGITRFFYVGGGCTDVCVADEPDGPMDFAPRGTKPDGATW